MRAAEEEPIRYPEENCTLTRVLGKGDADNLMQAEIVCASAGLINFQEGHLSEQRTRTVNKKIDKRQDNQYSPGCISSDKRMRNMILDSLKENYPDVCKDRDCPDRLHKIP